MTDNYQDIMRYGGVGDRLVTVVGNKIDRARSEREVQAGEGRALADEIGSGIGFNKVSMMRDGSGVDEIFHGLAKRLLSRSRERKERRSPMKVGRRLWRRCGVM